MVGTNIFCACRVEELEPKKKLLEDPQYEPKFSQYVDWDCSRSREREATRLLMRLSQLDTFVSRVHILPATKGLPYRRLRDSRKNPHRIVHTWSPYIRHRTCILRPEWLGPDNTRKHVGIHCQGHLDTDKVCTVRLRRAEDLRNNHPSIVHSFAQPYYLDN